MNASSCAWTSSARSTRRTLVKSRDGVPTPARDLQGPRRLRDRPGPRQARALGRGAQPLQAPGARREEQRRRAREVEHPAGRPDRLRQDAAGADAGAHPRRALHHGRRDDADRGRLCRRGRREHHPEAAAGGRLQCRAGAARHRLHRRGRQDQPQVGQPLDHPRRVGRGRAAGAAEDHGRHRRLACRRRAAASIRSRNSCRSTRPTSCSSAAAPSPAWRRSSAQRGKGTSIGFGAEVRGAGRAPHRRDPARGRARGSAEVRPDPGIHRPPAGDRDARRPRRGARWSRS